MINKTYQAGLLQAKAYRILRERTKEALLEYEINDIDWSILGLLYDQPEQTPKQLAEALSVKVPFITKTCQNLMSKNLIEKINHDQDGRSFYFHLTKSGNSLVKKIEPKLLKSMSSLLKPLSPNQLRGYIKTLEKITANNERLKNQ